MKSKAPKNIIFDTISSGSNTPPKIADIAQEHDLHRQIKHAEAFARNLSSLFSTASTSYWRLWVARLSTILKKRAATTKISHPLQISIRYSQSYRVAAHHLCFYIIRRLYRIFHYRRIFYYRRFSWNVLSNGERSRYVIPSLPMSYRSSRMLLCKMQSGYTSKNQSRIAEYYKEEVS